MNAYLLILYSLTIIAVSMSPSVMEKWDCGDDDAQIVKQLEEMYQVCASHVVNEIF